MSGHRGRSTPASVLTGGKPSDSPLFNLFLLFPPFLLFTLSSSIFSVSATAFTELRRGKLETGDQHLSRRRRGSRSNCQTCAAFSPHTLYFYVFFSGTWMDAHLQTHSDCLMSVGQHVDYVLHHAVQVYNSQGQSTQTCDLFFAVKALTLGYIHQGLAAIQSN